MQQYTELFLIRHGETAWNCKQRIQGHLDIALNQRGIAQAQAVAKRLRHLRFSALYSSDLARAHATARPLAALTGMNIHIEPGLRERHFGVLQGVLRSIAINHYAQIWEAYHNNQDYCLPAGESSRGFAVRCMTCLETLVQRHPGERIAAVTHGGVLSSLLRQTLNIPHSQARPFTVYNTGINIFSYHHDKRAWRMDTWGDITHLQNLD